MDILDYAIQKKEHLTLDMKTVQGWTPLQKAAELGFIDACNLLIENGANPLYQNN